MCCWNTTLGASLPASRHTAHGDRAARQFGALRDHRARASGPQRRGQARTVVERIEHQADAARLEHGENRPHHGKRHGHEHRTDFAWREALVLQDRGKAVGLAVEFAVSQFVVAELHGARTGVELRTDFEAALDRLRHK
jgi:hypothetical protein